ncbi:DinB family protein [Fontibacillus phaseoli]|uniref:DinB family protein n=1 Tax=Fontibacillus phaseoli TaxID=1416533 RepID=A0A369BN04_9BACL|nr:DinB family protein [Fontibacillus phaseoli]RCX22982.1 DinB family protein [Fontibacillus phaseoli]
MLKKPQAGEYATHFETYIQKVPEGNLSSLLEKQVDEIIQLLGNLSEEDGAYRYAEGKWSLKEVLGHISDTERVMSYRLLRIARGDTTPLPGFEENLFVGHAKADRLTVNELLQDFAAVRIATLSLIRQLDDDAWERTGTCSEHPCSALALAYIIAGHAIHHVAILQERYLQK